jgi:homoserine dehydrogenase
MKECKVAMLGFGVAGKAFSRILLDNIEEIRKKTGYDVKVTSIATATRGTLNDLRGIDLAEAIRQVEEDGHFDRAAEGYCE